MLHQLAPEREIVWELQVGEVLQSPFMAKGETQQGDVRLFFCYVNVAGSCHPVYTNPN